MKKSCPAILAGTLAVAISSPGLSQPLQSSASTSDGAGVSTVRILPGWQTEHGDLVAGLEIALAPGWKTYWRAPGASGLPPQFDWSGSSNLGRISVGYPEPMIFEDYGQRTIGYQDRVVLPLSIEPLDDGQPVALSLSLFYGVCLDICIPAEATISSQLGAFAGTATPAIEDALTRLPIPVSAEAVDCAVERVSATSHTLRADVTVENAAPALLAVVELPGEAFWVGSSTVTEVPGGVAIEASIDGFSDEPLGFDLSDIRLTLLDASTTGQRALEISGC